MKLRWTGLGGAVGLAAAAFLAVYGVALLDPSTHRWLAALAYPVPPIVAFGACVRALRRPSQASRGGLVVLAVSMAAWVGAELVYSVYSLRGAEAPFPSAADAFYGVGYVGLVAAIPLLAKDSGRQHHAHSLIDVFTVFVVATVLLCHFVVVPTLREGSTDGLAATVGLAYPVADLALVLALFLTFYWYGAGRNRTSLYLGGAGFVMFGTDIVYSLWVLDGGSLPEASVLDLGWLLAYWLIAMAALGLDEMPKVEERPQGAGLMGGLIWPYVATILLTAAGVREAFAGEPSWLILLATPVVVLCLLTRQWLALSENRTLVERLQTETRRREDALVIEQQLVAELRDHARELERLRDEAHDLARIDVLTGLANRRGLEEAAAAGDVTAVAVIDVDNFKRYNDRFGHPAGDANLHRIAHLLRTALGPEAVVGRIGGDEFAVLFREPWPSAVERAGTLIGQVRAACGDFGIGISCGLAPVLADDPALRRTFVDADRALYRAKLSGKGRLLLAEQRPAA